MIVDGPSEKYDNLTTFDSRNRTKTTKQNKTPRKTKKMSNKEPTKLF